MFNMGKNETGEAGAPQYLTREQIDAADDLTYEPVEVPEWGGTVLVRGLTGTERARFEGAMVRNPKRINLEDYQARLVVSCLVDGKGNQLYSAREVANLGRKSAVALNRVYEVAQRLSGLTDEDADELLGE